jgi:hypothetical protein
LRRHSAGGDGGGGGDDHDDGGGVVVVLVFAVLVMMVMPRVLARGSLRKRATRSLNSGPEEFRCRDKPKRPKEKRGGSRVIRQTSADRAERERLIQSRVPHMRPQARDTAPSLLAGRPDISRGCSRHRLPGLFGDGMDRPGETRRIDRKDFCDGYELVTRTACRSAARIARSRPRLRSHFHRLDRRSESLLSHRVSVVSRPS